MSVAKIGVLSVVNMLRTNPDSEFIKMHNPPHLLYLYLQVPTPPPKA
jgi:hypothetical protein